MESKVMNFKFYNHEDKFGLINSFIIYFKGIRTCEIPTHILSSLKDIEGVDFLKFSEKDMSSYTMSVYRGTLYTNEEIQQPIREILTANGFIEVIE